MEDQLLIQTVYAIETHDAASIIKAFQSGLSPNALFREKPLIDELTSNYLRSDRFQKCMQIFVDFGLEYPDELLLKVLLDDAEGLRNILDRYPSYIHKKINMKSAFTPLEEASLLHVSSEFGSVKCAKILLEKGLDSNVIAGIDELGFGGQTPLFHTVNQHNNFGLPMLQLLLDHGASAVRAVKALIWGKGYDWETYIPSVNPISYAMMGLLRQFQRSESDVYLVVNLMMQKEFGINYEARNVPNKYLYN